MSIARPRPGPDAALVRVRAVGLCGSWLAVLAGTVPAERLAAMRLIVAPGTIVRWHRTSCAAARRAGHAGAAPA